MGRPPGPDDLVCPLDAPRTTNARPNPRHLGMKSKEDSCKALKRDLAALGLRHRRGHDLRTAFISLALDAGADRYLVGEITHTKPKRSAFDAYVRAASWPRLCDAVASLDIHRQDHGQIVPIRSAS